MIQSVVSEDNVERMQRQFRQTVDNKARSTLKSISPLVSVDGSRDTAIGALANLRIDLVTVALTMNPLRLPLLDLETLMLVPRSRNNSDSLCTPNPAEF